MKLNLANKLTVLRVIMVPFFVLFMLLDGIKLNYLWAGLIFIVASLTDYIDGQIARKRNMVTNFGKFLDPLADKILVMAALVCFVELGWAYGWAVIAILAREFAISGVRLVAASSKEKIIIAADKLGKLKTATTMIAIIVILALQTFGQFVTLGGNSPVWLGDYLSIAQVCSDILILIATALTLISGISYIAKNKQIFTDSETD